MITQLIVSAIFLLLNSKLPSALRIAAGSLGWNQETDIQSVPVYNVYVFDSYNSTFQLNDIALLKVILFKYNGKYHSTNKVNQQLPFFLNQYNFYFLQFIIADERYRF